MRTKLVSVLVLSTFLGISGCEAPVGDVGPQGVDGQAGEKGDKGSTGEKGAFNAIVSPWIEIKPSQWRSSGKGEINSFSISDRNLTQSNIDGGLILAYYRTLPDDGSSRAIALNYETQNYVFEYHFLTSGIFYTVIFQNEAVVNPLMKDWNILVRHIIVPPAKAGRLKNINWKDYNQVKKLLDIED